jgi:hypothetical protein
MLDPPLPERLAWSREIARLYCMQYYEAHVEMRPVMCSGAFLLVPLSLQHTGLLVALLHCVWTKN